MNCVFVFSNEDPENVESEVGGNLSVRCVHVYTFVLGCQSYFKYFLG